MFDNLKKLHETALKEISEIDSPELLTNIRNNYLSKKSELMKMMSLMKNLNAEDKAKFGQEINAIKQDITNRIEQKRQEIESELLKKKLESEVIDFTLPSYSYSKGSKHPFQIIIDDVSNIFIGMGYNIVEGTEVELDHFNFELLNVPKDHPARDMQDSFTSMKII